MVACVQWVHYSDNCLDSHRVGEVMGAVLWRLHIFWEGLLYLRFIQGLDCLDYFFSLNFSTLVYYINLRSNKFNAFYLYF